MQVGMYLSGFEYFTCPIEYDPVTYARITECQLNPAFQLTDYHIPLPYALVRYCEHERLSAKSFNLSG